MNSDPRACWQLLLPILTAPLCILREDLKLSVLDTYCYAIRWDIRSDQVRTQATQAENSCGTESSMRGSSMGPCSGSKAALTARQSMVRKASPSHHFILTFECSCESHNIAAHPCMHFTGQESNLNLCARISQRGWWQGTGRHRPQCPTSERADRNSHFLQPFLAGVPTTQRTFITWGTVCRNAAALCWSASASISVSLRIVLVRGIASACSSMRFPVCVQHVVSM